MTEQPGPRADAPPSERPAASPIADLSYRTYDGPIHTRAVRWWIVALAAWRTVRRKPGFWVVAGLACMPYFFRGVTLYIQSIGPHGMMQAFTGVDPAQQFTVSFYEAFSGNFTLLMVFVVALMAGAGSIAADNRSNALQLYLSKPITKGDYLLGKWMGVFLVVFGVVLAPNVLLYLYCLLSFTGEGFFRNDPFLLARLVAISALPAAIHASLLVGTSAWSKVPRMAGAVYAGFYFVTWFVATLVHGILHHGNPAEGVLVNHLSIGGVIAGLAQGILNVGAPVPPWVRWRYGVSTAPIPPIWAMLALAAALVAVGVLAARARINAVEVVRG